MAISWKGERLPFESHKELCHKCERQTIWEPKGGRRSCSGCSDIYPCKVSCTHEDCAHERALKYKSWASPRWTLTQPWIPGRPGWWEAARIRDSKPLRVCVARTLAEAKQVCEMLDVVMEGVW